MLLDISQKALVFSSVQVMRLHADKDGYVSLQEKHFFHEVRRVLPL